MDLFFKLNGGVCGVLVASALTLLAASFQATRADTQNLVLLCKGTSHCATCADSQKQVDFDWTYTIDFSAGTVDGIPAKISDARIAWQLRSSTVLDEREISRYSKKFHYAGKSLSTAAEIYYGDGICTPQQQKAF
jgi:hypothetical protein